ncbi:acylphosphatase [Roseospira goensis]|uniref:acylphosphatase n=1 Tax=Roseospira goensis TaxID=391922 RepID=A0A7W6S0X4_9PROT|nr:acylphosphatase [Roseospira goensis]MBB4286687.1 acylphosphatase [Roseospira goensis]
MTEQADDTTTVRVSITGRVQGVAYRAWTEQTARRLGLDGWVRNRADGSVEAVFQGPPPAVGRMVAACHDGPPAARVTGVTQTQAAPLTERGFRQRATAP